MGDKTKPVAAEVTHIELRIRGMGPSRRLQVLAQLKGEDRYRLLLEEHDGSQGEIGHCVHLAGILGAPFDTK